MGGCIIDQHVCCSTFHSATSLVSKGTWSWSLLPPTSHRHKFLVVLDHPHTTSPPSPLWAPLEGMSRWASSHTASPRIRPPVHLQGRWTRWTGSADDMRAVCLVEVKELYLHQQPQVKGQFSSRRTLCWRARVEPWFMERLSIGEISPGADHDHLLHEQGFHPVYGGLGPSPLLSSA